MSGWICDECTQENEGSDEACIACEVARPAKEEKEDNKIGFYCFVIYGVARQYTSTVIVDDEVA